MINEQIRDKEVRVIGANNEQLGIMSIEEAMKLAEDAGVDLVKIAPNAAPPVCRIIDYGKFRYEQSRKEKATPSSRARTSRWKSATAGAVRASSGVQGAGARPVSFSQTAACPWPAPPM